MRAIALLFIGTALFGQAGQPTVNNAKFETRAYSGDLGSQLRSQAPGWFGYAVKGISSDNQSCCWANGNQCGCSLEGERSTVTSGTRSSTGTVQLEGSDSVAVLFRVENNEVKKVRALSLSCPLDAGGLPFVWLTGVPARDSLRYLQKLVAGASVDDKLDGAIMAVAQHQDSEADSILQQIARSNQAEKIREKAIFWLGASRRERGTPILKNILDNDSSEHIRDKAIFALSINKDPKATDYMIAAAREDKSAHIRGQALFWLAQKAGKQSVTTITNAIYNDPDTGVKEKAVFALSQLPKDEGVPKLIEVARDQRNPEVRKKAFFWLGQSRDPRALAFIEQVLTK